MQAAQDGPEKPRKRTRAPVGIFYAERSNVDGIVTHPTAHHSGRLFKLDSLQIAQRRIDKCSH